MTQVDGEHRAPAVADGGAAVAVDPCAAAANGEYVVGISFEYRANREKAQGKPIDLVFPKEGLGWDNSPSAHMWRTIMWPTRFL